MSHGSEYSDLSSISFEDFADAADLPSLTSTPHLSIQLAIKQARPYLEPIKPAEEPAPLVVRQAPPGLLLGLPHQAAKRQSKEAFNFNMMVAGRAGLGKSTFLGMLFSQALLDEVRCGSQDSKDIDVCYFKIEENRVMADFTVIETPSYGDSIDNTNCSLAMVNYIDKQLMRFMYQEEQPDRTRLVDSRVNVCLYFVEPSNRSLHPIDLEAMKEVGYRANLIPVIAKADTMTTKELCAFKEKLASELQRNDVRVYKNVMPFSVICSNTVAYLDGRECFARVYNYGIINCENPAHSDFTALCNLLMKTNTLDLIQSTHDLFYHYERMVLMLYRSKKLTAQSAAIDAGAEAAAEHAKDPLELLKEIQQVRLSDLEEEHTSKDPLWLKRMHLIELKYYNVGRYQSQRFQAIHNELEASRTSSQQQLKQARFDINELQERIAALRVRVK